MFEGKLTSVLNKLLGEYVHGISAKDLSVAVFKGDVVLKNLRLKTEALNALGLQTSGQQATAVLQKYDTYGRGVLSLGDFRACVDELRRFQGGDLFRQAHLNKPRSTPYAPPPPASDGSRRHPRGMVIL